MPLLYDGLLTARGAGLRIETQDEVLPLHRLALAVSTAALLSCAEAPTEPNAWEIRFKELMATPALEVSSARDSAFREAIGPMQPIMPLGLRLYRQESEWAAAWSGSFDTPSAWYRPAPAVDFAQDFVLRANAFGRDWYRIEKLTQLRDTTFIVVSFIVGCSTGQEGLGYNLDLRLVPRVTGPVRFAVARHVTDCRTGRTLVEYLPS